MHPRTLAMIIAAAAIAAGCASKETKTEAAPAPAQTQATTPATAAPSKPVCPPEATGKKKSSKTKTTKKGDTPPPDCEPAKPAGSTKAAEPAPAAAAAPAAGKPSDPGKPRIMKSRDGTFEGEVYGNIPPNSKWAKLQIGMEQPEVERILGGSSNDVRHTPTGKAFIPFYYGTDRYRYEVVYRGQGSVSYTGGSWGGGRGVLMMINYDPNI